MSFELSYEIERKLIDIAALEMLVTSEVIPMLVDLYWAKHEEEFVSANSNWPGRRGT